MKIAVYGNTPFSIGITLSVDLTALGHKVTLCGATEAERETIRENLKHGLSVHDEMAQLQSRATGRVAAFHTTEDPATLVQGAELIFIDTPPAELETRLADIAPSLTAGQHIHVQTHGYWVSVRGARTLQKLGVFGVTFSEGTTPTHASGVKEGVITPHAVRQSIALGVFPAKETETVGARMMSLLPIFDIKKDVLETNLESMNFLVHPAIALTGISLFQIAKKQGRKIRFYQEGNTADAGALGEALDGERAKLVTRLGYEYRTLAAQICALYGSYGSSLQEVIQNAPFYHNLPDLDPDIWRHWMSWDLPLAHVPFVRLSEALGYPADLHKGLVDVFGAILGKDYWKDGLCLDDLGFSGMSAQGIQTYLRDGLA